MIREGRRCRVSKIDNDVKRLTKVTKMTTIRQQKWGRGNISADRKQTAVKIFEIRNGQLNLQKEKNDNKKSTGRRVPCRLRLSGSANFYEPIFTIKILFSGFGVLYLLNQLLFIY